MNLRRKINIGKERGKESRMELEERQREGLKGREEGREGERGSNGGKEGQNRGKGERTNKRMKNAGTSSDFKTVKLLYITPRKKFNPSSFLLLYPTTS